MSETTQTDFQPLKPHLWQIAASMAERAHQGQIRKDKMTPYSAHPVRVAFIVRHIFGIDDEATIAAAFLHDVIEDTSRDYDDVLVMCGKEVADLVAALTKDMRLQEDIREPDYDKQIANASWKVKLIKLADTYDNLTDANTVTLMKSTVKRAHRAITLAGDDARLKDAVQHVNNLLQQNQ